MTAAVSCAMAAACLLHYHKQEHNGTLHNDCSCFMCNGCCLSATLSQAGTQWHTAQWLQLFHVQWLLPFRYTITSRNTMAHCTMTAAVSCAMAAAFPLHYHQQEHNGTLHNDCSCFMCNGCCLSARLPPAGTQWHTAQWLQLFHVQWLLPLRYTTTSRNTRQCTAVEQNCLEWPFRGFKGAASQTTLTAL